MVSEMWVTSPGVLDPNFRCPERERRLTWQVHPHTHSLGKLLPSLPVQVKAEGGKKPMLYSQALCNYPGTKPQFADEPTEGGKQVADRSSPNSTGEARPGC